MLGEPQPDRGGGAQLPGIECPVTNLLICDLDGTLVDSFPGVALALRDTIASVGMKPLVPIDRSIIGPPLDELLAAVVGPTDSRMLGTLRSRFIDFYDGGACTRATPYPGVAEMLHTLASNGHSLALATNKRLVPTLQILRTLGWQTLFQAVESLDSRNGDSRSKPQMLADIVKENGGRFGAVCYLGDTEADMHAAQSADISFILAAWGYGSPSGMAIASVASSPEAVPELLLRASRKV